MSGFRRLPVPLLLCSVLGVVTCTDEQPVAPDGVEAQFAKPVKDPVVVDYADPSEGIQGQRLWVTVYGEGFEDGFRVLIESDGSQLTTHETRFKNANELEADIEIPLEAALDLYDIVAYKGGKRGIGIERFLVKQKDHTDSFILSTESAVTDGFAFPLQVQAVLKNGTTVDEKFRGWVSLTPTVGTITPNLVYLRKGVGSALVTLTGAAGEPVTLTAAGDGKTGDLTLDVAERFFVNGKIAFCSDRGGDGLDLYVLEGTGDPVRVTNGAEPGECRYSLQNWVWSPDGSRLAFKTKRDGSNQIHVVDVASGQDVNITNNSPAGNNYPSWSPDGTRIVFHSPRDGDQEIHAMDPDGANVEQLTDNTITDYRPDWSPDGDRIAFVYSLDDIGGAIATYDITTGVRTDLTPAGEGRQDRRPLWSPDGGTIAFWAATWPDGRNLFLIDPDDPMPSPQQLTYGGYAYPTGPTEDPAQRWSPDGQVIAITDLMQDPNGLLGENSEVVLVPVNGDPLVQFTNSPAHDRWGDWGPNPGGAWNDGNSWIVFESDRDGVWSLLVKNIETGEVRTLTDVTGNDHGPVWWRPPSG